MTAENCVYKVDPAGRVIIPAHLRKKFGIVPGNYMEYYTGKVDGRDALILIKRENEDGKEEA